MSTVRLMLTRFARARIALAEQHCEALLNGIILSREFNLTLASRANARGHTKHGSKKNADQRALGMLVGKEFIATLRKSGLRLFAPHATFVRRAPRMLDSDNLETAFKSVRDGVAEGLGISDATTGPAVWWTEQQFLSRDSWFEIHIVDKGSKL